MVDAHIRPPGVPATIIHVRARNLDRRRDAGNAGARRALIVCPTDPARSPAMKILLIAVAVSVFAASAGAQQAPPVESRAEANPDADKSVFVTTTDADLLASRLVGTSVTNREGETIGEVTDLIIRGGSELTGIVVSVGGFLGIGERLVVLDPSGIAFTADGDNLTAATDARREALEVAPEFKPDAEMVR
jgi:PRC-barrel domain